MKHVEVQGKEIVISNVGGKFYAMDDRCGHMNALLSMGNISKDGIVTCPFHAARFEVTTGKKIKEPVLAPSQQMEPLPKNWQKYLEHAGELMSHIKTYDLVDLVEANILTVVQKPFNQSTTPEKSGPPAWKQLPPPPGTPGPFSMSDQNSLKNSYLTSGFKDPAIERMNVSFEFDSPDDFTTFTIEHAGPSLQKMLAGQTYERKKEILKAISKAAEKYADNTTGIPLFESKERNGKQ
jgi:nitrite reductase/ring-hydroxylating ferredoxin subunit